MLNAGNFTTKAALSAIDDWLDKEIVGIQSVLHNHSIFVAVVTKSLHYDHFYELTLQHTIVNLLNINNLPGWRNW
jgi:hypothetical protein